jgi:alpha-mannosidase
MPPDWELCYFLRALRILSGYYNRKKDNFVRLETNMSQNRKPIHLLCNAHLDPVWQWEWEEGAAEAISTFRTAAELCEKDKAFVFNHNEVTLYQWVQEYEPQLFRRIQKLIKQGKWHIMGGWYLQPDCNMPSGESFVRQILLGKTYFKKHFGVEPTTAINFDPFGHSRGLVQILAKSGYDSYLFGRPMQHDCALPADEFTWVGFDGSQVTATRFNGWYNSHLGKASQKVKDWIQEFGHKEHCLILWGVGNHGGGPSRKDVRDINSLIRRTKDYDIIHSTPEAFFRQIRRAKTSLPKFKKSLNPWAVGCYTSQIRIKQKMRQLENEIYMVEKMAATAGANRLMRYPQAELGEALHDLMVGQFHDILPGSSIQPVEDASLRMLDHGLEITSRLKARAFFALSIGQSKAKSGTIPIMVYNPHPYPVRQLVECEFQLPDFDESGAYTQIHVYQNGRKLLSQVEKELGNIPVEWRKRVVFPADLQPGQMNRFDCTLETLPKMPITKVKRQKDKIVFHTPDLQVTINSRTGLIDQYRVVGVNCLASNTCQPIVMQDDSDPWGMLTQSYRKIIGRFRLMSRKQGTQFSGVTGKLLDSVRVIEDGNVRTVVEAMFAYGDSFIVQRYKLPKVGTEVEIETRVLWNEKDKLLKLSLPIAGAGYQFCGQTAYGVDDLPANGNEAVAQKWVALVSKKRNLAVTCINDGNYGCDYSKDGLRLTLLRSPAYANHPWEDKIYLPQDRFTPRQEQGERTFRFWLNAGKVSEMLKHIDREALVKNEKPFALSFNPPGAGRKPKPLAVLQDDTVQMTCLKKAERNSDLIIRLFEPTGRKRSTILRLPILGKKIKVELQPFEIKSFCINLRTKKITEVDLLEK